MADDDAMVRAWCARDHARALLPQDHAAVDATSAPRALVVHLLRSAVSGGAPERDLFHACAILGRQLAERGASPTLAVATLDGAAEATGTVDAELLRAARAAVAESYAAARLEAARAQAAALWEYPACAVPLDAGGVALAAGFPSDDGEAVAAWAARVAHAAVRGGVRRAIVAGRDGAREALVEALAFVGIDVRPATRPR